MKVVCRRDMQTESYDLNPFTSTIEDLFVLIASTFGIAIEDLAIRCGTFPSVSSRDDIQRRLSDLNFVRQISPSSGVLELQVMSATAAASLDAAAARVSNLFRQGGTTSTSSNGAQKQQQQRMGMPGSMMDEEEIQRRLYETIQQRNIEENFETAMEYTPEVFASVKMLYVTCVINGVEVKAFVDSGAQMSIMSIKCAERCNLLRLVDRRMNGVAIGVGKQRIIGKIHIVTVRLQDVHMPFSFSVLDEQPMDVIIGLDQLKRHQMIIDLKQNCLSLQGIDIPFLPDGEVPNFTDLLMKGRRSQSRSKSRSPGRHGGGHKHSNSSSASPQHSHPHRSPPPPAAKAMRVSPSGSPQRRAPITPLSSSETKARTGVPEREERKRLVKRLQEAAGITDVGEAEVLLESAGWDIETAATLYAAQFE